MFGKGKLWSVSATFGYLLAFLMISVIIFCYSSFSATPESPGSEEDMIGTAEWFAEREEIYRDRNRRIEYVCNNLLKFSDTSPHLYKSPTQGNSFWFDLSHHLAVCMHPKVGCTTWRRNMLLLSNLSRKQKMLIDTPNRLHTGVRPHIVLPDQGEEGFDVDRFSDKKKLLKFSFVRHPYERLISCYEDKVLQAPDTNSIYFDLVNKYEDISFVRFVQYVLEGATKNNCFDRSSACPINEHFRPYINNCHYCYVNYEVIGHLEDSFEDTMYIAMKQNLTTLLPELTKTNRKTKGKKSSQDRIEHYMSQLNTKQKRKLYELYQLDFELFGYDPGDTMCKNEACIE